MYINHKLIVINWNDVSAWKPIRSTRITKSIFLWRNVKKKLKTSKRNKNRRCIDRAL